MRGRTDQCGCAERSGRPGEAAAPEAIDGEVRRLLDEARDRVTQRNAVAQVVQAAMRGAVTDIIRKVVLPTGLVDVKVCAINADWSGLKLMVRKERRAGWNQ